MPDWISERIESQQEVGDALKDLAQKIHKYKDAARPSCCRESKGTFLSAELEMFRPGWKLFTAVSVACGVGGAVFSLLRPSYEAGMWADIALTVTVPVFVLGVSLVTLARSMSESGRFAVEYLNKSCRMAWFCCLTFIAVLAAFVGQFVFTIEGLSTVAKVGLCAASLGAAIICLAMLAFVVCETIRCTVPSESLRVVSQYAGRNLSYGYLKEAYVKLFRSQYRNYLEKWCLESCEAIHPPSQYYGHYFRSTLRSGNGDNDFEIGLDAPAPKQNAYKDYDLDGLAELDRYLTDNHAELYLSSPDYESERGILGVLSSQDVRKNEELRRAVLAIGKKVVRWKASRFVEENEDFWESQQSALGGVIEKAVDRADPIQLRAYLDAVNVPISVLRQVRRDHKVVRDAYGEYIHRGYDFVRLYLRALREILARQESEPKHRSGRVFVLAHTTRNSIWEETKKLFTDMDYHTMELFTWLVPQLYEVIQGAGDQAEPLRKMRAQFGGLYEFSIGWLEDGTKKNPQDADRMRLVLHDGITKWLLIAIKEKDPDLIEQLCDAGRKIVFGPEGIKFSHRKAAAQHFVLAGRLLGMSKSGEVNATAVERLFFKQHSHTHGVDFDELVRFYLDSTLPHETLDSYLNIFYSPNIVRSDLFTGTSHSSGFGMTGVHEISWAFIYLAASALSVYGKEPAPIAEMSGRISDGDIKVVEEIFKSSHLNHGFEQVRGWLTKCEGLNSEQEAKEIAEAEFDEKKVAEWKMKFWEGCIRAVPVLSLCLKNGIFKIDNKALFARRYILPKIAFVNWKYSLSGAEGDEYGIGMGQYVERDFLSNVASKVDAESEVEGSLPEVIGEAASWLEKEGCNGDTGIIVAISERPPDSELYQDKDYIPSWKEEVRSQGFHGFYKGYPIVWLQEERDEDEEEVPEKVDELRSDKVVAVDIKNWTGMHVREDVISKNKLGDLVIREWTEDEINNAIESKKLEKVDINKAKGNCPVDVSLFWMFSGEDIPRGKIFSVSHSDLQKEEEIARVQ